MHRDGTFPKIIPAVALAVLAAFLFATSAEAAVLRPATVVRVVDGDTVRLRIAGTTRTSNLRGIDAPERGECYGAAARRRLAKLLPRGARVVWRGGEILRRGRSVNIALARGGYAETTGEARGALGRRLRSAARSAQDAGRGLHGRCDVSDNAEDAPQADGEPGSPGSTSDPAGVREAVAGTAWFWTQFDQAGTGGTTDRTRIDLCSDGTIKIRRSSVTEDGQGNTFTVIAQDFAKPWTVTRGSYNASTRAVEAVVEGTVSYRRVRTAQQGVEESAPNQAFTVTLSSRDGQTLIDGKSAFLLNEPANCEVEP